MKPLVSANEMKRLENYAMEDLGIPSLVLMERAAYAAFLLLKKRTTKKDTVMIAAGVGNNGADGLALARILLEHGYRVIVVTVGKEEKETSQHQMQRIALQKLASEKLPLNYMTYQELCDTVSSKNAYIKYADVFVDALLGIGGSRTLSGDFLGMVQFMNQQKGLKLALDLPTGLSADTGMILGETCFMADETITFGAYKIGMYLGHGKVVCGQKHLATVGITYPFEQKGLQCQLVTKKDLKKKLQRNPLGNKGSFGKLAFLAGNIEVLGAPILMTEAAFSVGAGYVKLFAHPMNRNPIVKKIPELVFRPWTMSPSDDAIELEALAHFADVFAAGPGLGTSAYSYDLLKIFLEKGVSKRAIVLDADALNLLAEHEELWDFIRMAQGSVVLTPHMLEFSRLCHKSIEEIANNRITIASEFAKEKGVILVLKDAVTLVANVDGQVIVSESGNDGMAVAGCGDCLAGIIAGFVSGKRNIWKAVALAVNLHGSAGDMAAQKHGKSAMLPTDLIRETKKLCKKYEK